MKIGIITAMPEETGALLKRFASAKRGCLGNLPAYSFDCGSHRITLCEGGIGFNNAAGATETMIREAGPEMLLSSGFCGGITPNLKVGDLVMATSLMVVSGTLVEEVPAKIHATCGSFVISQAEEGNRVFGGLFASTPAIMQKARLSLLLPPGFQFHVVEMESAAVATAAMKNGIPFAGIRAVSDPFDEELDFSLDELCDGQMRIRIPQVLLTIMRKPRIVPQLVRLARNSRIAGVSLGKAVEQFLTFI
jgi:adenosylhomocysteine nucleosidase